MRRLSALLTASLSAIALSACGGDESEAESSEAGLSVTYVSGHLGSESACPALTAALRDASCAAPCTPNPCENGALLVRVKNIADHAVPVHVVRVELIAGGQTSELHIVEVASTDSRVVDELGVDGEATLRILFPKPINSSDDVGRVHLVITGENDESLEIKTPELQLVPPVAT